MTAPPPSGSGPTVPQGAIQATVPCLACRSQIPAGALKCVHCDSYQGWRRHLEISSLALSLLVALVSVSGIVVPALIKAVDRPASEVAAKLISIQPIEIRPLPSYAVGKLRYVLPIVVLITNTGERPALVEKCVVSFRVAGEEANSVSAQLELFQNRQGAATPLALPLKLEPGAFSPFRLLAELQSSADLPDDWSNSEVRISSDEIKSQVTIGGTLELSVLNSDAADTEISVEIPDQSTGFLVPSEYERLFENWRRLLARIPAGGS